jgi:hypothetical protein
MSAEPEPGSPKVEFIAPDLVRWTSANKDRRVQDAEFTYWCGWFGLDESDRPYQVDGNVWLIHKGTS